MRNFFSGWYRLIGNLHATSVWYIVLMFDALTQKIRWKQHLLFFSPSLNQIFAINFSDWGAEKRTVGCRSSLIFLQLFIRSSLAHFKNIQSQKVHSTFFIWILFSFFHSCWRLESSERRDPCSISLHIRRETGWRTRMCVYWISVSSFLRICWRREKKERMEKMPPPLSCI